MTSFVAPQSVPSTPRGERFNDLPTLESLQPAVVTTRWLAHCQLHGPKDLHLAFSLPGSLSSQAFDSEQLINHSEFTSFWSQAGDSHLAFAAANELIIPAGACSSLEVFHRVQSWAKSLRPCLTWSDQPAALPLRVSGGVAFQPDQLRASPWESFAAARFTLPRLAFRSQAGSRAQLSLFVRWEEQAQIADWLSLARRFLESLPLVKQPSSVVPDKISDCAVDEVSALRSWSSGVRSILDGIQRGHFSKVVLARQFRALFEHPLCVPGTLLALRAATPGVHNSGAGRPHPLAEHTADATRFAFRAGDATFLGATPERLVWRQGDRVQSQALAGTFRVEAERFAAELLRSPKEHLEHVPVLKAVVEQLQPFCETLTYSPQPELQAQPHLLHLHTPISGRLRADTHVLELVERLHPTPAVGGVPTSAALAWLLEHEGFDRGWYAGPVGWFDLEGNGEFVVGLRSAVLRANEATLFAGAGIVAGSDPSNEFAETELKLRRVRAALRLQA